MRQDSAPEERFDLGDHKGGQHRRLGWVTPHGLRGSGATVDVVDAVVSRVSKQLGHAGTAVTIGHYVDGDTMDDSGACWPGPRVVPDRSPRSPSNR
jgi:hypothetical protein